jgi:5-methylcytosine-specific restriction endonuclease McrA
MCLPPAQRRGTVYGWDSLVLLQHLLDDGLSKTAIAQRLGVSCRVIYHWLATGQLTRAVDAPVPRRADPVEEHPNSRTCEQANSRTLGPPWGTFSASGTRARRWPVKREQHCARPRRQVGRRPADRDQPAPLLSAARQPSRDAIGRKCDITADVTDGRVTCHTSRLPGVPANHRPHCTLAPRSHPARPLPP